MIYFIRHASTEESDNKDEWSDLDLIVPFQNEVEKTISLLEKPIDYVYSSDLNRAKKTLEFIAKYFGVHVKITPELREFRKHGMPPESYVKFSTRIEKFFEKTKKMENVVIITHKGVLREILKKYVKNAFLYDIILLYGFEG